MLATGLGEAEQNPRPFTLPRFNLQLRPHQLRALAHELEAEVAGGPGRQAHDVESAPVVGNDQLIPVQADTDLGGGRMLADVLEGFLGDAQDRRPGRWREAASMPSTSTGQMLLRLELAAASRRRTASRRPRPAGAGWR
jgi:hypothetical protein